MRGLRVGVGVGVGAASVLGVRRLSAKQTRAARAHAQGLGAARATSVAGAVKKVVALQAQDVRANRLAVRVRTGNLEASDVDAACARREVVRTWAMRGTLHMVAAEDLGWVTQVLGPYFAARQAPRRRQLGLDDATCARGAAALETVLAGGPRTRGDIVEQLADHGLSLDPRGQAPPYLLAYAALTGLVCRGPDRDEPTYVLVREWVGEQPAVPDAEVRLASRYLAGYGPAGADDLAAWSGLPLGRARAAFEAIADLIEPVEAAGAPAYLLRDAEPPGRGPHVRLLGHFDAYLLGYRGRDLAVPEERGAAIQSGGGFVMPAVAVDGLVVGTWRQQSTKDRIAIQVTPFTTISARLRSGLDAEVVDLGRFLGRHPELA